MTGNSGTTRREFLAWSAALATGAVSCGTEKDNLGQADMTSLIDLTAGEAVSAMLQGDISAEAYAGALLDRCQSGEHLNAFISFDPARVLEAAKAADASRALGAELPPLHGLPIPIKDSVNTAEYATTGGTRALRNFYPAEDSPLVQKLKAAGAIVLGKTNIHELSFGWTSDNQEFGAVHNPYDTSRIPGGSSGGTAAAIAARMAPIGIAEDTQGSIRVPAAMCGLVGFRPTLHRYPNQGVIPITPLFDQVGPLARNVADLALFDHVMTGEPLADSPTSLRGLRLGVPREYFYSMLDVEVERICEEALLRLADAGAILVEAEITDLKRLIDLTTARVQLYHVLPMLTQFLADFDTGVTFDELMAQVSPDIQTVFSQFVLPGSEFSPTKEDFTAARDQHLPALQKTLADYYHDNNLAATIFPVAQITAPLIGQNPEMILNGQTVSFGDVISRNISPGSTGSLPSIVVPAGLNRDGLPVCLELDGPAGSDRSLLGIGVAIESVLGQLPPPRI
tara:strand:+ start:1246 stop:2775 length:1530 start_codon:yes stop_codon:yes gene_type:complete